MSINLFHVPDYTVDTSKFTNLLHDPIKAQVERAVAKYVGAKYAVAVSSCTDGIFLALKSLGHYATCTVPSLVTTRFLSAIIHSGNDYLFTDDVDWVGSDYRLMKSKALSIWDSAQRFDPGQYKLYDEDDIVIFSNYPTKPLGGLKGGIVVSNNKEKIDWIRQAAYFGESFSTDSWNSTTGFIGYQMYMNSVEAYMVSESLKRYQEKRTKLDLIRKQYKMNFNEQVVTGNSYHLFRIRVDDNRRFLAHMQDLGIHTGIHYDCANKDEVYGSGGKYPKSEYDARTVASIPFHTGMSQIDVHTVIKEVHRYETI